MIFMWCDEASKYCENCCAKIVVVFSSSHSAYILQYVQKNGRQKYVNHHTV